MLLEQVVALVKERGWEVVNVDSVVIAERPKLKPHIEAMRTAIAERMGLCPIRWESKPPPTRPWELKDGRRASPATPWPC